LDGCWQKPGLGTGLFLLPYRWDPTSQARNPAGPKPPDRPRIEGRPRFEIGYSRPHIWKKTETQLSTPRCRAVQRNLCFVEGRRLGNPAGALGGGPRFFGGYRGFAQNFPPSMYPSSWPIRGTRLKNVLLNPREKEPFVVSQHKPTFRIPLGFPQEPSQSLRPVGGLFAEFAGPPPVGKMPPWEVVFGQSVGPTVTSPNDNPARSIFFLLISKRPGWVSLLLHLRGRFGLS